MDLASLSGITGAIYLAVFLYLFLSIKYGKELNHLGLIGLCLLAILLHGWCIHLSIDTPSGQNLSIFNILSFTSWLLIVLMWLNHLRQPTPAILLIGFPFAGLAVLLAIAFPGLSLYQLKGEYASLVHIFSAMVAFGLFCFACIQAGFISLTDYKLRQHPANVSPLLPPLVSMERLLFQLVGIGFILLSISLAIAGTYLQSQLNLQTPQKLILSILAWLVFAGLLIGRKLNGWRGIIAAKWTLVGFVFLVSGYFGSKILLELNII